jgi:hypothetical protein
LIGGDSSSGTIQGKLFAFPGLKINDRPTGSSRTKIVC